jgi:hypothetical protein
MAGSQDSIVDIAAGYELDDRGGRNSSPGRVKNFLISTVPRPALGPTASPIQQDPGYLSLDVNRQEIEADHTLLCCTELRTMELYSSPPQIIMELYLIKHYIFYLYIYYIVSYFVTFYYIVLGVWISQSV